MTGVELTSFNLLDMDMIVLFRPSTDSTYMSYVLCMYRENISLNFSRNSEEVFPGDATGELLIVY